MLSVHNSIASTRFITRHMGRASRMQSNAMEQLSSGLRINKASDDPSGLLISEQLRSQIEGLQRAVRNTDEAGSLLDIMDGALGQVQDILRRMQTLAVHAANQGVTSADQVAADQAEMDNALLAINQIFGSTEYGGRKLLNSVDLFGGGSPVQSQSETPADAVNPDILNKDFTFVVKGEGDDGPLETTLSFKKGQSLDSVLEALRKVDPSSVLAADPEAEDDVEGALGGLQATVKLSATSLENLKNLSNDEAKEKLSGMMQRASLLPSSVGGLTFNGDFQPVGVELDDALLEAMSPKDRELFELSNSLGNLNLGSLGTVQFDENGDRISGYSLQDLFSGGAASLSRDPALALQILKDAHDEIGMTRASIGASRAYQEHYKEAKEIELENLVKSESGIRDADMAQSMVEFTKANILTQVGTQMLSSVMENSRKVLDLFA